jgi:hypothetical protein
MLNTLYGASGNLASLVKSYLDDAQATMCFRACIADYVVFLGPPVCYKSFNQNKIKTKASLVINLSCEASFEMEEIILFPAFSPVKLIYDSYVPKET